MLDEGLVTQLAAQLHAAEQQRIQIEHIGAHGIQVPQIETFDETVGIVNSAKYFPLGNRGGALTRSADYGNIPPGEYFRLANEHTILVIQCETKQALDNLEYIAQVPNIDVIFLGPFDMSISLGVPSEINHPKVIEAEEKVLEVSLNYDKIPGIYVRNAEQAMQKMGKGFRYIVMGTDNRVIVQAYKELISPLKL
ncbi:HpcH/HpaI aldolase family protein [Kyrpidia tusciae]|uniref:HpcH/HpaI aldolase family protein n=1 Tax=Kyrpidia tusciae TaxID=33943 RepID=UPI0006932136|nr:aldolase/citrate lyase family protein [Kyrpidia tusciae]